MGVGYLKGERMTGGETTKGKWSGLSVRGGSEGGGEHGTKRQVGWSTWKGRELT